MAAATRLLSILTLFGAPPAPVARKYRGSVKGVKPLFLVLYP
jgi:hypothetical protein